MRRELDIPKFEKLPEIVKEHLYKLYSEPNIIRYARGSLENIVKRVIQDCEDTDCRDAMQMAFKWLVKTGQVKITKQRLDATGEQLYKARWHSPKEKRPRK